MTAAVVERAVPARPSSDRRFAVRLGLVALVAAVVRVAFVLAVTRHDKHLYDSIYYELQARTMVDGWGFFTDPFQIMHGTGRILQAADHPPFTVLVLVPAAWLGPQLYMRLTMVLLGVTTVVLIGLIGRRLGGDTVGLVAAGMASVYANLWINDGLIMSEPVGVLLTTALLLVGLRVLHAGPTWPTVAALGLLGGFGMLTRAEFVLFIPFLVVPVLWVGSGRDLRRAAGVVAGAGLVTLLVVGPWVAFNMSRFDRPTVISTNDGLALRAANCHRTYYGSHIGWVDVFPPCAAFDVDAEQSVIGARNRSDALRYMRSHATRIPLVALARLGRTWNVFNFNQTITFATNEGRPVWASRLAAVSSWLLLPLAGVGAVALRRRRQRIWPFGVVFVAVHAALALWAGGLLRYRASAEPVLVLFAAVGLVHLLGRSRRADDLPTVDGAVAGGR
jgi:4-amino-4-deoxy-L-arabinose transferase-like glycosyltransferase